MPRTARLTTLPCRRGFRIRTRRRRLGERPLRRQHLASPDTENRGARRESARVFAPTDGALDDWGRHFRGRDEIASWNRTDNIGKSAHFEVESVEKSTEPDTVVAVLTVSGGGFNGTGPITFRFTGDLIREVIIAPTE
ncbi:nuclear transport factor 2 family protein [Homoserinibacter sp. GY 40078]|uniref:nuclear transport factor 2 family protein n=1 Tax=Homoserinibacter sp. GY 40078 TaxID=2603275 RepID=UPI0011CB5E35|nr:nuclear transport factor 2 family protein [Homoserinibacter sp. GY 40078]TXK19895.1 nuclear transport factor 2 family protein [Homoserinibacter sp. GY 40078]